MTSLEGPRRLLYFSPAIFGGLADYAREQANALGQAGVEVDLLSSSAFPIRPGDAFRLKGKLPDGQAGSSLVGRRLARVRQLLAQYAQLARVVEEGNYRHVLLGSYAEYLAPLWSGSLQRLARRGVVWGAIIHDPVRDYVVGPHWWHRRSIGDAYSFLREAFVHEPIVLDTVRPMPHLHTTVIPHGPLTFPPATETRNQVRLQLSIPETAQVWLSFGHIRDGKNLDLVIRALARFPQAYLVVAGKEQSSGQKNAAFYQKLARECGVAERCIWLNRFIAPEEVGSLFVACDLVLLTYSGDFRSASGVLNAAANFRKPCLASGGQGNLQTIVSQYQLGAWVDPDREDALVAGLQRWQATPPSPRWDAYAADHSWLRNAELVCERMFVSQP